MNEAMLLSNKSRARALIGYNADTGLSIGRRPIDTTLFTPRLIDIQTAPATLAGKSRVLRSNSAALSISEFAALNVIGGKDFTLEVEFYADSVNENNYFPLMYFVHANGQLGMQLPDTGFGYRLQGFLDGRGITQCYATPQTRSTLHDGKFHHIALVRKGGRVSLYLDGVAQGVAGGTSYSYADSVADATVLSGASAGAVFHALCGNRAYCAGFALYDEAIYTKNFTPALIA